mmetsp:Transcript_12744/g.19116  ORF Transcript_12744/g.19116 Transcript_12744/m.19116 type:complete len:229 (-) Transcript_12744:73-759(-)
MLWQSCKYMQESYSVSILLSQSQYSTTANTDTSISHIGNGIQTILISPGGDNIRVMLWRSIKVMIVCRETSFLELLCLFSIEHTKSTTNLESHSVDTLDHFKDMSKGILFVSKFTPSSSHTEPRRSSLLCSLRRFKYLFDLHGWFRLDKRLVPRRLGTIATVFGTSSSLDGEKGALLNFCSIPVHAMNGRGFVHEIVEGQVVYFCNFVLGPVMTNRSCDVGHGTGFLV